MLEIRHLNVFYGKAQALKDVSLTVDKGEIVALIGNNAAGKSTLLTTVSGLNRPASGEIVFQGANLTRQSPDVIVSRGIIHVPEGRRIFPALTVAENLRLGAFSRARADLSDDYQRVFELFPRIMERVNQAAGTLSGGEQQMLAVARALMARPKLLMLDEPSLGLAPLLVEAIYRTIIEIHQQGTPVLLVEQNAYLALTNSDRAYVIEAGQIVLSGEAASLLQNDVVLKTYLGER